MEGVFMIRKRLFLIMGNFNMIAGNGERAKAFYKAAIDRKSKSALAYLNYAVLLMQEGDENLLKAKELLQKGLSLKRKKPITEKNLLMSLGTCLWLLGDLSSAIEKFEYMRLKYTYVNAGLLTTLGYVYLLNGEFDKAEEITRKALEDDPSFASAWDNMGQLHYRRGDYAEAKEAFEKAVGFKELPDSLYFLGVIAERNGGKAEAAEWLKRAEKAEISAFNTVTREQIEEKLKELGSDELE
jgi:tetratricopeptide (TPR) repeat protein